MTTATIKGREYRAIGPYVGTIQYDGKAAAVYIPYKEWLEISRNDALGKLSSIALMLFPDAGATWRRAFPVKDGEEAQGHDLWAKESHARFYPHHIAPPDVLEAFELKQQPQPKD